MGYLASTTLVEPQAIPRIQIGQRQVSEYQEGGIPFGFGDGLALTGADIEVRRQALVKLTEMSGFRYHV